MGNGGRGGNCWKRIYLRSDSQGKDVPTGRKHSRWILKIAHSKAEKMRIAGLSCLRTPEEDELEPVSDTCRMKMGYWRSQAESDEETCCMWHKMHALPWWENVLKIQALVCHKKLKVRNTQWGIQELDNFSNTLMPMSVFPKLIQQGFPFMVITWFNVHKLPNVFLCAFVFSQTILVSILGQSSPVWSLFFYQNELCFPFLCLWLNISDYLRNIKPTLLVFEYMLYLLYMYSICVCV